MQAYAGHYQSHPTIATRSVEAWGTFTSASLANCHPSVSACHPSVSACHPSASVSACHHPTSKPALGGSKPGSASSLVKGPSLVKVPTAASLEAAGWVAAGLPADVRKGWAEELWSGGSLPLTPSMRLTVAAMESLHRVGSLSTVATAQVERLQQLSVKELELRRAASAAAIAEARDGEATRPSAPRPAPKLRCTLRDIDDLSQLWLQPRLGAKQAWKTTPQPWPGRSQSLLRSQRAKTESAQRMHRPAPRMQEVLRA